MERVKIVEGPMYCVPENGLYIRDAETDEVRVVVNGTDEAARALAVTIATDVLGVNEDNVEVVG